MPAVSPKSSLVPSLAMLLFALAWLLAATPAAARGTYLPPADFIQQSFANQPPAPKLLWLDKELQKSVNTILGHDYPALRLRYWRQQQRSLWVLEEIGKEQPITLGIVVNAGAIETFEVLIFRESRGSEIRHPFFTRQFDKVSLDQDGQLSSTVDGISGATLSVRAATRLARLALLFHQQVVNRP